MIVIHVLFIYVLGDIAYYDKDGFIFIVDRLKEIIKYNALQVWTEFVEFTP